MHCALNPAAGAKAMVIMVIMSKALWKRIEMLFYNVSCALQELNYYHILIRALMGGENGRGRALI